MNQVHAVGSESDRLQVPDEILDRLRSICMRLPEVVEETAWVGTRWMVRQKNFAHVLAVDNGWPPAYARAADSSGPVFVMTFRTGTNVNSGSAYAEYPYFVPTWFANIVGLVFDDDIDWDRVRSHIVESYSVLAPKKLAAFVLER